MPYIKKETLKLMLRDSFMNGCISGYGFDHEESLSDQQEKAFEVYYKSLSERVSQFDD